MENKGCGKEVFYFYLKKKSFICGKRNKYGKLKLCDICAYRNLDNLATKFGIKEGEA